MSDKNAPRILLIRLSALGDLVVASRYINAIRKTWPDAHLTLLTGAVGKALYQDNPVVDEVMLWSRRSRLDDLKMIWRARSLDFDYVIDLHSKAATGFVTLAVPARGRAFVTETPLQRLTGRLVARSLTVSELVQACGDEEAAGRAAQWDDERPRLNLTEAAVATARQFLTAEGLDPAGKIAALSPGASAHWPSKRWPARHFAELAASLRKKGYQVILTGDPSETGVCDEVASAAPGAVSLAGRTRIGDLLGVLSLCRIAVTNDSGPMHLAAALGTPTIGLFGPTNAERIGPATIYGVPHVTLKRELDCMPCHKRECPLGHHDCLEGLLPGQVLAQVELTARGE